MAETKVVNNVHEKKIAVFSGVTGGIVVAAFVADPLFGLLALAVGGTILHKKLSHQHSDK